MNLAQDFTWIHQPSTHLRPLQDFRAESVHFQSQDSWASLPCLELLLTLFGLASKAAHKSQRAEVVSCDTGCEVHVSQLLVTPASPNAEEIN